MEHRPKLRKYFAEWDVDSDDNEVIDDGVIPELKGEEGNDDDKNEAMAGAKLLPKPVVVKSGLAFAALIRATETPEEQARLRRSNATCWKFWTTGTTTVPPSSPRNCPWTTGTNCSAVRRWPTPCWTGWYTAPIT